MWFILISSAVFSRSCTINHRIRYKLFAKLQLSERGRRKQAKVENMRSEINEHLQCALVFHRPIRIHTLETECVSALFLRFFWARAGLQIMMPSFSRQSISHPPLESERERLAQWCWWCGGGV
jgi:hypothetical protein